MRALTSVCMSLVGNKINQTQGALDGGSSLFALLDDIATLLDDISLMSKVAAKKSASILSDDLAVKAEQVIGKDCAGIASVCLPIGHRYSSRNRSNHFAF